MPRKSRQLIVTATFESNRMEEHNINMAYEFVFPIKQGAQRTTARPAPRKINDEKTQQLQILSLASNQ
jgi:hypothetical protein